MVIKNIFWVLGKILLNGYLQLFENRFLLCFFICMVRILTMSSLDFAKPKSSHSVISSRSFVRETARHYIAASESDLSEMKSTVGIESLEDLYTHIDPQNRFNGELNLPDELDYESAKKRLEELAAKNAPLQSFGGDGLADWSVQKVVEKVSEIRKLATSYTPYQPERSQGTLMTQWIYQCLLSQITGFEAVNSSLYERSTAIFEALQCALRQKRNTDTVLVPETLYPGDRKVLDTLAKDTPLRILTLPADPQTGLIDETAMIKIFNTQGKKIAAVVYAQVNGLGLLEDVDSLNDAIKLHGYKSVAVIDPFLIATGMIKRPIQFGVAGADMIVGEAQHLVIGPNFGGPGLGVFGLRHNTNAKNELRSAPGRFVGKAIDSFGRECRVMVLSTREQHIRKEKATSNICSNQAFLATLAGASILQRGQSGFIEAGNHAHHLAENAVERLTTFAGVSLAFPTSSAFNEITLSIPSNPDDWIEEAAQQGILLGVNVSGRISDDTRNLLKISFSDHPVDLSLLTKFFTKKLDRKKAFSSLVSIPLSCQPEQNLELPQFLESEILTYYQELGELNLSPDDGCYPLGSCTMKYNPKLNEYAANLPGFTQSHPQAPLSCVQGNLELLFEIQEWFKAITGLAGLTTQPVAGAQGELVGLKLFQAYHRNRGDVGRNIILIPKSAHGTNFATATMAGFVSKKIAGKTTGIVLLEADKSGRIDLQDLQEKINTYSSQISGIMITNPNTGGVFETEFKFIADQIHQAGGLVYMDGANMNAIAGWVNLGAIGVDAVHNNLHKTWSIPHGGGGPGDAIVAVSEKLVTFLPGYQIEKKEGQFVPVCPPNSIGSFHRHWGNFAHKVRCYTYLLRLGKVGVPRMSAVAVLASRYLLERLRNDFPLLPKGSDAVPRMHEFILSLDQSDFDRLEKVGVSTTNAVPTIGKAFLDFGYHAPTVAFPEIFGLMIEPTESYTKAELDRFVATVKAIKKILLEHPESLKHAPHFTPVDRIDEVSANRNLVLMEKLDSLPPIHPNRWDPQALLEMEVSEIIQKIQSPVTFQS